MYRATITFTLLSLVFSTSLGQQPANKFEATFGCLQYNTNDGYEHRHPYFSISQFRHLNVTRDKVKMMRMGVVGQNDGLIRLAPVFYPYDNTAMNEIVLSGWANTKTVVRHYTRSSPADHTEDIVLKEQSSVGMLSPFEPFMFTLAIYPSGLVTLTRDGDELPFLEYQDTAVSANYVGFCNWDVPLVVFYDCPLETDRHVWDGLLFNAYPVGWISKFPFGYPRN